MICKGYKISGYDATYRKTTYKVTERGEGVLEIMDYDSGTTFILDLEDLRTEPRRTGTWKSRTSEVSKGVSIAYGSKGWYQQLTYGRKKRKMRTKGGAK